MVKTIGSSLKDLHKLKHDPPIEIQRAGGFYKARWAGRSNFVFGGTAEEAKRRLMDAPPYCLHNSQDNTVIRKRNFAKGFNKVNDGKAKRIGHKARSVGDVVCVLAAGAAPKGDAQVA